MRSKFCPYCGDEVHKGLNISVKRWDTTDRVFCGKRCQALMSQVYSSGYLSNYLELHGLIRKEAMTYYPEDMTGKWFSGAFNKGFGPSVKDRYAILWLLVIARMTGGVGEYDWRMIYNCDGMRKWVHVEQGYMGSMAKLVIQEFGVSVDDFVSYSRSQYKDFNSMNGVGRADSRSASRNLYKYLNDWGKENKVFKPVCETMGEVVLRGWFKKKRLVTVRGAYLMSKVLDGLVGDEIDWRMLLPVYVDKDLMGLEKKYL